MTENYITPDDLTPWEDRRVLLFLNSIWTAEQIADKGGRPE